MANQRIPDIVTRVTYADAQTRGLLRTWKTKLAKNYAAFDRAYRNPDLDAASIDFVKRSGKGRRRVFDKVARTFGPGAILEGLRLEGNNPLAVWSILKPRNAVTVNPSVESGEAQDCVCVNYIVLGRVGDLALCSEGLWTMQVPDHALGRAVERSRMLPDTIITDAHHNLLALSYHELTLDGSIHPDRQFLVKAGDGGFVCSIRVARDVSLGYKLDCHVRTHTWLASDMLRDDQILLIGNGLPSERLGDGYLLPPMLRQFIEDGPGRVRILTRPGMPELIGASAGNA